MDRAAAYRVIEQELIEVLGPMGTLVRSEHLERAGGPQASPDLSALLISLCTEIDSPKKSALFRQRVRARLR